MKEWILMAAVTLVIPVTMMCVGFLFMKRPPKRISAWFGFRTGLSMKNRDTWNYAHRCAGRLWWRMGKWALILTLAVLLLLRGQERGVVGIAGLIVVMAQCVPLVAVIPLVERELERTFDREGRRKT